jgi:hypothetical protein
MSAMRSQIFMIPPGQFSVGNCAVCDHGALIKFRDHSTGWNIGDCCLHAVLSAERALSLTEYLCHPRPELEIPNH